MPYKDPEKQRAAQRRYYEDNKALVAKRSRETRTKIRRYVEQAKHGKPCADCKMDYPAHIMQFDHVRGIKISNISNSNMWGSLEKVIEEIAKCELVCANCHAHRTWVRQTGVPKSERRPVG